MTLHWPETTDGTAAALQAAGEVRLPSAYELDDAPAFERFFLVRAATPFSVATAVEAARALAAQPSARTQSLALPPGFEQILARARQDARRKEGAAMTTRNPLPAIARGAVPAVPGRRRCSSRPRQRPPRRRRPPPRRPTVRLRRFVLLAGVDDGGPTRRSCATRPATRARWGACWRPWAASRPRTSCSCRRPTAPRSTPRSPTSSSGCAPARTAGVRRELLVYYSGHSDEDGLLVGRDRVGYDELRARVQRAPAELRVVILDSCASGAFTRRKGGVKRAPFLIDASIDMRGHAFLTSSAADERAQESDRIAASFFTYYLVSGLRGAADVNQDRRVTLQEAYQFASQETLARTERTQAGPQHAAYEFDLAGTGDMVVTDVRGTQSGLVLTPELGGRITVREANGALVAELRKPAGNTIELGLEPGAYVVAMDSGSTIFQANVALAAGKHTPLARRRVPRRRPARGDGRARRRRAAAAAASAAATATATATRAAARVGTDVVQAVALPASADAHTDVHGFSFGFVADRSQRVHGFQLALGWAQTDVDLVALQLAGGREPGARHTSRARRSRRAPNIAARRRARAAAGRRRQRRRRQLRRRADRGRHQHDERDMKGLQMAGGANWVGDGRGLQMAGGVNLAKTFTGLQMAPVNYADTMDGLQLGVVNVARTAASGFRFGVVNVAGESHGFQFGVVNVAKHDDGESFALINLIGNGIHDVSLFATDVMATNVGFKLGGRHLYTNLIAGYQPGDELRGRARALLGRHQALRHRRGHRLALPRRARPARLRRARG